MAQVMINEVSKLPDNITIDEPVPGEGNRQQRVWWEQSDTIRDDTKWNELPNNAIEHVNEERDFILRPIEILMCKCQQDLYDNDEWNERRKNGLNSFQLRSEL